MSDFKVTVTRVLNVEDHPNADRLSLVTIMGYVAISAKMEDGSHRYKTGDLVVYLPEATIIPENLLRWMDFWDDTTGKGKLAGKDGNRIKAMKLRGIFSLGLLFPVAWRAGEMAQDDYYFVAIPYMVNGKTYYDEFYVTEGEDVAALLGVEKWNPPVPVHLAGEVCNIFGTTMKYDFENFESVPDIFEVVEDVVATEKLHGSFLQIGMDPKCNHEDCFAGGDIFVGSKGLSAQGFVFKDNVANDGNLCVKALRTLLANGFADKLRDVSERFGDVSVHVFSECFGRGVQDLTYGFEKPVLRVFDIAVDRRFLPYDTFLNVAEFLGLETVPELYRGPFDADVLCHHRDGKTTFNGVNIREGIVVKSVKNDYHPNHGRVIAKMVSPDYRLRKNKDATEYT